MSFGKVQMTNAGRALLVQAAVGGRLHFTRMQMGSGRLTTQAVSDLSALVEPVKDVDITSIARYQEYASLQGQFTNQGLEQGFWWREIGIFAKAEAEGEEVLFSYANAYDLAEYISAAGSEIMEKTLRMSIFISSVKEITATINSSLIYVSMEDFTAAVERLEKEIALRRRIYVQSEMPADEGAWLWLQLKGLIQIETSGTEEMVLKLTDADSDVAIGMDGEDHNVENATTDARDVGEGEYLFTVL